MKGRHFTGLVDHEWDNGTVFHAGDNETKTFKTKTKISRVKGNALETFLALAWEKIASDSKQRRVDLGKDWGAALSE